MEHLLIVPDPKDIRLQMLLADFRERVEALKPRPDLPLPQDNEPE